MNIVHLNDDAKKIFPIKPNGGVNESNVTNNQIFSLMQSQSLRNFTGDRSRIPPRRHMPFMDKNGEEHLSNQRKQRYWNSWEELYLVELWRRFKDEVTVINVPLPVYRKMMIAMRNRNMVVTAQDCRRKINTLNTRYKQELKRIESSGCKSEWRLFPLIHCVMEPKIKSFDPWHETKVIKKLLDKLPKPIEDKPPVPVNNNNDHHYLQSSPNLNSYQPRLQQSTNTTLLTSAIYADSSSTYRLSSAQAHFDKLSILPFRNITWEKIDQLRQDNNLLAMQRDEELKRLQLEEKKFKCFEEFIRIWTEQKELELQRVQRMSKDYVIKIENENNHNVEQVQEAVAAK